VFSLNYQPLYQPLSQELLLKIRSEAFQVLADVGFLMELEEAFEPLEKFGCRLDRRNRRIFIPSSVTLKALDYAPKTITLYDRFGQESAVLKGHNVHFDPGSAALNLLDYETGRQRQPRLSDLLDLAKIVSQLPHFTLQSTALVPADVPQEIADSIRLYAALKYCPKPVITGTFRRDSFKVMLDMLTAVRGGAENLRDKPLAIFDCCPSPPLMWSELTAAAVIECAQSGIPCEFVSMPLMGATAPVTYTGALVQHTAEDLSGVVLAQSIKPGTPVIYGGSPAVFDMRHGTTPMGAIETILFDTAYAQVGKSFNLPIHAYMGLSDSRNIDYQAGLESGLGAVLAAAAGINIVSGPGMLDFESCQSWEKLVLDNDICGMALHLRKGIAPLSDPLGYDIIKQYALTGDFLKSPETRKFYRAQQYFPSNIIERSAGGMKSGLNAHQRAHLIVQQLLSAEPETLTGEPLYRIQALMSAEAAKFGLKQLDI